MTLNFIRCVYIMIALNHEILSRGVYGSQNNRLRPSYGLITTFKFKEKEGRQMVINVIIDHQLFWNRAIVENLLHRKIPVHFHRFSSAR